MSNDSVFSPFAEQPLLKADSSTYGVQSLSKFPSVQDFGLGALLKIGPLSSSGDLPQPPVAPLVKSTISSEAYMKIAYVGVSRGIEYTYTYRENATRYVLLPAWKIGSGEPSWMTEQQAVREFKRTGKHLGIFSKIADVQKFVNYLSVLGEAIVEYEDAYLPDINFGKQIISLDVSYSIDGASEIKFTVIDPNYRLMELNYFMPRRAIFYRGETFEMGVVEVGQGPGSSPQITVTCWNAAVQRMKRDKNPSDISGDSVYEYALNVARKFDLKFVGEKTTNKQQTINKGTGNNSDESVWSVLSGAANSDEFVLYVIDDTLVYASQEWLLWKFGTDSRQIYSAKTKKTTTQKFAQMFYDPNGTTPELSKKFTILGYPSIRYSENDALEGDGSIVVAKPNGCIIRPGHTVWLGPKPTFFRGGYLVTGVQFSEGTPDPVSIEFRTPEKPKKQEETD